MDNVNVVNSLLPKKENLTNRRKTIDSIQLNKKQRLHEPIRKQTMPMSQIYPAHTSPTQFFHTHHLQNVT